MLTSMLFLLAINNCTEITQNEKTKEEVSSAFVSTIELSTKAKHLAAGLVHMSPDVPLPTSLVAVWDAKNGQQRFVIRDLRGLVGAMCFTPDEKHLVTGELDVAFWDAETGRREFSLALERKIKALRVSSAGTMLGASDGLIVTLWDIPTHREIESFALGKRTVWACQFSSDLKKLATLGDPGTVEIWDLPTRKLERIITGSKNSRLSPDRVNIGVIRTNGDVGLIALATGQETIVCQEKKEGVAKPYTIQFSPDARKMIVGENDGRMHVWDSATKKVRQILQENEKYVVPLLTAATSDDSLLIAGAHHKAKDPNDPQCQITLWRLPPGSEHLRQQWTFHVPTTGFPK